LLWGEGSIIPSRERGLSTSRKGIHVTKKAEGQETEKERCCWSLKGACGQKNAYRREPLTGKGVGKKPNQTKEKKRSSSFLGRRGKKKKGRFVFLILGEGGHQRGVRGISSGQEGNLLFMHHRKGEARGTGERKSGIELFLSGTAEGNDKRGREFCGGKNRTIQKKITSHKYYQTAWVKTESIYLSETEKISKPIRLKGGEYEIQLSPAQGEGGDCTKKRE